MRVKLFQMASDGTKSGSRAEPAEPTTDRLSNFVNVLKREAEGAPRVLLCASSRALSLIRRCLSYRLHNSPPGEIVVT